MDDTLRHLLNTAKESYARRDFSQARAYLEQVVDRHQGYADVYHMLGVVYHDGGLFTKAQAALEQALQINPRYTEAALSLAVLYNDLGKYTDARETYARALAVCKTDEGALDPFIAGKIANMHAEIADAYRNASRLDLALGEYGKALSLCPAFADIRTRLASALMEARQFSVAAQELRRALEDRPSYLPARVQLGLCAWCLGRTGEAADHWQAVLALQPDNPTAAMYLRMVQGGSELAPSRRDDA
jgi:Tfp pilus assembly protein PilF